MNRYPDLHAVLDAAWVDEAVFNLRGDYRVYLVAADGLPAGAIDPGAEALLAEAESAAMRALAAIPVDQVPQVAAWRDAYRAFGAKPQRTRNSLEALMRRAASGLPRVNNLTDIYNAISVLHRVPVGGEDLDRYSGPARLVRAAGDEPFDTVAGGDVIVEYPEPGEVVWRDDAGVTCRRWNWRQARRTQLSDDTTSAVFILDALDPITDQQLADAAADLAAHLARLGDSVRIATRMIAADS